MTRITLSWILYHRGGYGSQACILVDRVYSRTDPASSLSSFGPKFFCRIQILNKVGFEPRSALALNGFSNLWDLETYINSYLGLWSHGLQDISTVVLSP